MDFLPGFEWPVPRAFASAVSACRFEQGDVFYDAPAAYAEWKPSGRGGASSLGFRFRVQVLDPPRSTRGAPADAEGNRFVANWTAPVTCEISDYETSAREEVLSTQGRLFSCLWRGDRGLLAEARPGDMELPVPLAARDLQKHLEACAPAVRRRSRKRGGSWFVSVVDEASESSLAKARAIESALAARYRVTRSDLSPAQAGVQGGADYHPALRIRGVWVDETRAEALRDLLKGALYGPSRAGGKEGGPDRFKLERHGVLVAEEASPA